MHEEGRWEDEFLSFQRMPKGLFEFELDEQRFDVILFDAFRLPLNQSFGRPKLDRMHGVDAGRPTGDVLCKRRGAQGHEGRRFKWNGFRPSGQAR